MSHFGKKPISGGRPPRESRIRGRTEVNKGALVQEVARALIVVVVLILRERNIAVVITMYVAKARVVREGAN